MINAETQGRRLLSAVERILDDNDNIIGRVRRFQELAREKLPDPIDQDKRLGLVCDNIVQCYSNLSAVSGGATAIPACLPGVGTLVAVAGGALVDVALVLKFEVEMAMALSYAHGYDITSERERQLAFLLASVGTYDAKTGRNFFVDVAEAEGVAIFNYAPRELSKLIIAVLAKLALEQISKGLARAIPLLGIGIGAGVNKVLSQRVGRRVRKELATRSTMAPTEVEEPEDIVDAQVIRD